jgi:predicted enzyme related to lactoylglutathione lyase
VAKSAPFYRDAVGLELKSQHEGLAFFSLSGITLMLNGSLKRAGSPLAGATEIVFAVESVTAAYDLLAGRGCHFVNRPRELTAGSWGATFTDPDGHYLTVFGPQ